MATTQAPFISVIDISHHQADTDFNVMRSTGVQGVILRAGNGRKNDSRYEQYYRDARSAGFSPAQIGSYWFLNPRADADGGDQGRRFANRVKEITGSKRNLLMLDIEDYSREGGSNQALKGAAFQGWIMQFDQALRAAAPESVVIAYSNQTYWDPNVGRDTSFASKWEWIVPRYPVHSESGYKKFPLPDPSQWADWAFARATGPKPPAGAAWAGWQFSADFNGQGKRYGCSSAGLDLNIVRTERWASWLDRLTGGIAPDPGPTGPIGIVNQGGSGSADFGGGTDTVTAVATSLTVLPGEGFWDIGERIYGPGDKWKDLAMNALADANGGIGRVLHPGDVLKLPHVDVP